MLFSISAFHQRVPVACWTIHLGSPLEPQFNVCPSRVLNAFLPLPQTHPPSSNCGTVDSRVLRSRTEVSLHF